MTVFLPLLAVAFAAFCIWLTVRIVNRRERWAVWVLAAAAALAAFGFMLNQATDPPPFHLRHGSWVTRSILRRIIRTTSFAKGVSMAALQLFSLMLGPVFALEMPIAESPLPNRQESATEGLKRRFKDRFQNGDIVSARETDESVAVAAEWLELRDSAGERHFGRSVDFFLGFINGRCRVAPPKWWSAELEKGAVTGDGRTWFPCHRIGRRWRGDEATWQFSGFDAVAASGDKLTLKSGMRQLVLAKTEDFSDVGIVPKVWSHEAESAIAGTMDGDVCAVVFDCPAYFGGPPEIYCMNSDSGKVLWKRPVFVGNLGGGLGGGKLEGSFTEVTIVEDRIAVWVGHQLSLCFEVFKKDDGKRLATFATFYVDGLHIRGGIK